MHSTRNWLLVLLLCLGSSMIVNAQKNKKFPLEDFTLFPPLAFLHGHEAKTFKQIISDDLKIKNTTSNYLKDKSEEAEVMIEEVFQTLIGNTTDYQEIQFDSLAKTHYRYKAQILFRYLSENRGMLPEVESLTMNDYFSQSNKKYSVITYYLSLGTYNKNEVYRHELDHLYFLIVENETKAIHYFKRLEFSKQRNNDIAHYKKQYALLLEYYKLKPKTDNINKDE